MNGPSPNVELNTENLTIWVKWTPNLAWFVAGFCSLCTHAIYKGSNSEPGRSRGQIWANVNMYRGPVLDLSPSPLLLSFLGFSSATT